MRKWLWVCPPRTHPDLEQALVLRTVPWFPGSLTQLKGLRAGTQETSGWGFSAFPLCP